MGALNFWRRRQQTPASMDLTSTRQVPQTPRNVRKLPAPPEPFGMAYYFASELVDERTCAACCAVDGRQYQTWEEALQDYPDAWGYRGCKHGSGCNGTLIGVAESEVPPTLRKPGER